MISRRGLISGAAALTAYSALPAYGAVHIPGWRGANALYVARKLGLTTGLQLVLDAGDGTSLPAAATSWLDLSGNGYDFFLGTTSGADATDPTIVGTAGQLSSGNYLSFDGGDYLTYDTTNETWMENLHKNNATGTFIAAFYRPATVTSAGLCGTSTTTDTGFFATLAGGAIELQWQVRNAGTLVLVSQSVGLPDIAQDAWGIVGISIDEAADSALFMINGSFNTQTCTYVLPAAGASTAAMKIGARGNAASPFISGSRLGFLIGWSVALTEGQITSVYQAMRGRFGI